jgi:hypothetical protein
MLANQLAVNNCPGSSSWKQPSVRTPTSVRKHLDEKVADLQSQLSSQFADLAADFQSQFGS